MEKFNKLFINYIIVLLIIFAYGCGKITKSNNLDNELRLRIIANSNSDIDQNRKMIVKNTIIEIFNECYNINEKELLINLKNKINEDWVESISVKLTNVYYEAKSYDGRFIPAGYYKTLLIMIGEGKGKNFWTILYPEFFNVTFEDKNEIEYRSYFYDIICH